MPTTGTFFQDLLLGPEPAAWAVLLFRVAVIAVAFVTLVSLVAMLCIWGERKVAGHIQARLGPHRVGPFGLLQSVADGLKLLLKEDICPQQADSLLFRLAPYIAFAPVFAAMLAIPFGPNLTFEPRLSVGVFWILAILAIEVMGVILAGWSSNNKWSLYGAMREACQMVSYEIPLGLSIIVGVMAGGTLNLVELGHLQGGGIHTWLVFANPFAMLAFGVYFVASLASNKRAPFDLPESESELVAGFHTEYSGIRFSFFFFAEYAAVFVVAAIQTALFLGGWHDPFGLIGFYTARFIEASNTSGLIWVNVIACAIFLAKVTTIILVVMWIRWTLPRARIDQVLYVCVKVLLPLACVLLLGAALWQLFVADQPGVPWFDYQPWSWAGWAGARAGLITRLILAAIGVSLIGALMIWIGYAVISGRRRILRLTDPEPIV